MQIIIPSLAALSFLVSGPVHAATDTGLLLHDTGIGPRGSGVGVSAHIRIKLGGDRTVRKADRVKLGLSAGPMTVIPNIRAAGGITRSAPSLASFEFKPGYSATFNLAGQSLLVDRAPSHAAADESEEERDAEEQSTGDKLAWIAAVAGGIGVIVTGVLIIKVSNGDFSE